ncbi:MAG: NADH-quinone oxidoreductase subunit C [Nitrospinae bacterium]|nr:NADH-quinone oxidoreductase subunit C [Nitrospinota bacterium]
MSAEHSEQSEQVEGLPDSCKNLIARLRGRFPGAVGEATTLRQCADELTVRVAREQIVEVCHFLKTDPQLAFDYLSDLSGVDYPDREKRFEVVYHLYSIPQGHRVRLKVQVAEGEAVPTVTGVWRTADWHEREAYDLLGIPFEGHPDLRRILLPDDWKGHPLRKEYPLAGYDGD